MKSDSKKDFVRLLIKDIYTWQCVEQLLHCSENFIFRGQSNSAWEMISGAIRNIEHIVSILDNRIKFEKSFFQREREHIIEFKKEFHNIFKDRPEPKTNVGWLAMMQHYGIPTRLLDFSKNINVAMYMCLNGQFNSNTCGFSLYAMNVKKSIFLGKIVRDNGAVEDFLKGEVDNIDAIIKKVPPLYLVELTEEDKAPNLRIASQDGLFIAPLIGKYKFRGQISEEIIGGSLAESLLRIPYFDSTGFPPAREWNAIENYIRTMPCIEFVFPVGIMPLIRELVKLRGVCCENVYPDLNLVDIKDLKNKLNFNNLCPELRFPGP